MFCSNYTFFQTIDRGTPAECSSVVPAGRIFSYAILDQKSSWFITSTSYTTDIQAWGVQINGYNIVPRTTFSSATSATSTTVGTPPATKTPQPSSGLSTGAKAGIGFGVTLWALALVALTVFFFAQRKRKHFVDGGGPVSTLKSKITGPVVTYELEGRTMNELEGKGMPAEIDPTY